VGPELALAEGKEEEKPYIPMEKGEWTKRAQDPSDASTARTEPESEQGPSEETPEDKAENRPVVRCLGGLRPGRVPDIRDRLLRLRRPVDEIAKDIYETAVGDVSRVPLIADLCTALAPRLDASFLEKVLSCCSAEFCSVYSDTPPATAHGNVVFQAELFVRQLAPMQVIKDMFADLLFNQGPLDHAVHLACHTLLIAGPVLDRSEVGSKMVDYVVMRLRELKGGKCSETTRFSIGEVTDLRNHRWVVRRRDGRDVRQRDRWRARGRMDGVI